MKDKMLEYMLAEDAEGCLTGEGAIVPAQRMNRACATSQWLSLQLGQQMVAANGNQALIEKQAVAAQLMTDYNACTALRTTAAQTGTTLDAMNDARCKPIEDQVNAQKTATANAGLTTGGFASVNSGATTPATTNVTGTSTTTANTANGGSGLMNSVYTSQSAPQQTVTIPVNNVQQTAPATNTVHLHH
jgi:hypothetical protein